MKTLRASTSPPQRQKSSITPQDASGAPQLFVSSLCAAFSSIVLVFLSGSSVFTFSLMTIFCILGTCSGRTLTCVSGDSYYSFYHTSLFSLLFAKACVTAATSFGFALFLCTLEGTIWGIFAKLTASYLSQDCEVNASVVYFCDTVSGVETHSHTPLYLQHLAK